MVRGCAGFPVYCTHCFRMTPTDTYRDRGSHAIINDRHMEVNMITPLYRATGAEHAAFVEKLVRCKIAAASDELLASYAEHISQSLAEQFDFRGGASSSGDAPSASRLSHRPRSTKKYSPRTSCPRVWR